MNAESKKKIEVLITFPLNEELVQRLNAIDPRLRIIITPARQVSDINDDQWQKTEILITEKVIPLPEKTPNLRWVQFNFAGIDFATSEPLLKKSELLITTLSGAAAPQVAEFILMAMLALGHKLPALVQQQRNHEWAPDRFSRLMPKEVRGSTVGFVGYGSIARELARILHSLDVKVLASKRNAMDPRDHGFNLEGLGDPEGNYFTRLYPIEATGSMVKECDFVVITLPKTDQTRNIFAEKEFAAMKQGSYLVDVSRGGIIKTQALKSALQEKKIAGAFLDVFEQEPLPKDSPLWDIPNLIISPHIAGISVHYNERAVVLLEENLRNYLQGIPLLNTFNSDAGY